MEGVCTAYEVIKVVSADFVDDIRISLLEFPCYSLNHIACEIQIVESQLFVVKYLFFIFRSFCLKSF